MNKAVQVLRLAKLESLSSNIERLMKTDRLGTREEVKLEGCLRKQGLV